MALGATMLSFIGKFDTIAVFLVFFDVYLAQLLL